MVSISIDRYVIYESFLRQIILLKWKNQMNKEIFGDIKSQSELMGANFHITRFHISYLGNYNNKKTV